MKFFLHVSAIWRIFFILLKLKPDVTFIDYTWIKWQYHFFLATIGWSFKVIQAVSVVIWKESELISPVCDTQHKKFRKIQIIHIGHRKLTLKELCKLLRIRSSSKQFVSNEYCCWVKVPKCAPMGDVFGLYQPSQPQRSKMIMPILSRKIFATNSLK